MDWSDLVTNPGKLWRHAYSGVTTLKKRQARGSGAFQNEEC
jgi:hypothetical protein